MLIALIALLVSFCCSVLCQRPNIVFILADDLGWNDVGFHGSNEVSTPNLDALAYSGVILRSHYSQALCTPSRAALLTGRYPIHTGTQHNVILEASPWGLPLTEKTLPQHLAPLGYSSHAIGKWHLGFFKKNYTPTFRGFESHFGLWNGFHDYYSHYTQASFSPFEGYDLRRGMEVDWSGRGKYTTRLLGQEAERLIANHNTSRPLFLYMAHLAVHAGSWERPLQAPQSAIRRFSVAKPLYRRTYLGMLWELDQSVGRLVKALEDKGILDDTIIVFASDNGAATRGLHKNTGSNFPLRGEKGTPWEGALRTSSFIWSRKLKRSRDVLDGLMHISDWLPTLYSAAGGDVKNLGNIDGVDQWRYINGGKDSPRNEILHNIDDVYRYAAIRMGNYKYINGTTLFGYLDDWVGVVEDVNESYDFRAVVESEAGRAAKVKLGEITAVRTRATVSCNPLIENASDVDDQDEIVGSSELENGKNYSESGDARMRIENETVRKKRESVIMRKRLIVEEENEMSPCDPLIEACLFDLLVDPCETNNLALKFPEKVKEMEARLVEFRRGMVPPLNERVESIANPALYNDTWTYWKDLIPPDIPE